jgi:hypothetical protein
MISRRTWACLTFIREIFSLLLQVYQWRRRGDDGESLSFVSRWLLAGVVSQTVYCWAYDRNLGAIRTKRWRRGLLAMGLSGLCFRTLPQRETMWRNISIGGSLGHIGYRLWYGVIRPLPDTVE